MNADDSLNAWAEYDAMALPPEYDRCDLPHLSAEIDHIADVDQVGEDDRQASNHVLDDTLGAEADGESDHRGAGHVGREGHAEGGEDESHRTEIDHEDHRARREDRDRSRLRFGMQTREEHALASGPDAQSRKMSRYGDEGDQDQSAEGDVEQVHSVSFRGIGPLTPR